MPQKCGTCYQFFYIIRTNRAIKRVDYTFRRIGGKEKCITIRRMACKKMSVKLYILKNFFCNVIVHRQDQINDRFALLVESIRNRDQRI